MLYCDRFLRAAIGLCVLASCSAQGGQHVAAGGYPCNLRCLPCDAVTHEPATCALFRSGDGNRLRRAGEDPDPPRVEVAVWKDGRVVWRAQPDGRTWTLLQGRVAPSAVETLLSDLDAAITAALRKSYGVPDSASEALYVRRQGEVRCLESCHESFEQDPHLVAFSYGIASLSGQTREEALAGDEAAWRAFRSCWAHATSTLRALRAEQGEPVDATAIIFE